MKRKPIHQFEIPDADAAFALVPEQTQDGARLAREAAQREADLAEAERRQFTLFD